LTDLALAGLTRADPIRMKESIAKKKFGPPEASSMSYMLSKQQYLNDRDLHWHPHVMFYMPGDGRECLEPIYHPDRPSTAAARTSPAAEGCHSPCSSCQSRNGRTAHQ
jgi:hypothetical protein